VVRRQPVWWHLFDVTVLDLLERPFHLIRPALQLAGGTVRAVNLRSGEVADSAFFTNRDPAGLSVEQVRWGPSRPEDALVPPRTITKAKAEGKTAGFFVTDARGVAYLFKLDPVDTPELLSGAETVTSKLLYALGYHVPSDEVEWVRPEDLRLVPGIAHKDAHGRSTAFGEAELRALLEGRVREGTVRVAASKILEGEILGPARFKRFRDCAEIRALKLAYAWVNNIDAKDHNSLLVWNGKETVGYLIDFGTSLGADAGLAGPKDPCAGWLNIVDVQEGALKLVTLGAHHPPCDVTAPPVSPGVGRFTPYHGGRPARQGGEEWRGRPEGLFQRPRPLGRGTGFTAHLDPERWKPYAPNLAFKEMHDDDARWMARRMARLSTAQVEAAVSAGRYSHPGDAAYLVATLEERREAIIRQYLEAPPAAEKEDDLP